MDRKKCVLITGGAGFIGSAIAARLGTRDLPIVALDNLHPQVHPTRERPVMLPIDVSLVVGDVTDADAWKAVLDAWTPSTVIHLAAETGTGQSLSEATRHANVNVNGTAVMLDAMTKHGIVPDHFVLASSRAVYGEGAWADACGSIFYPPSRSHDQLTASQWDPLPPSGATPAVPLPHCAANTSPKPTSIYGATKLAQEHMLGAWCAARGASLSVFRLQNVYGPGQSPYNSYTGIVTLFHRLARRGQRLDVYEDGRIGRDFVFIDDVVDALIAGMRNVPKSMRVLDVGSGVVTTIHQAALEVASLHGAPDPLICGKFRDGDVRWAVADAEPLERELGVRANVGFADGVRRVGAWLSAQGEA